VDGLRNDYWWLSRLCDGIAIMKRLLTKIAEVLIMLLFTLFVAVMLTEWLAGCGESYIDAKGVRHQYECVIFTHNFTLKEYFQ
jgi:hypothetical protein